MHGVSHSWGDGLLRGNQDGKCKPYVQGNLPPGGWVRQILHGPADQHLCLQGAGKGDVQHRPSDGTHPSQVSGEDFPSFPPYGWETELHFR